MFMFFIDTNTKKYQFAHLKGSECRHITGLLSGEKCLAVQAQDLFTDKNTQQVPNRKLCTSRTKVKHLDIWGLLWH